MDNSPSTPSSSRLTPVQWLICVIAAMGFAFDTYELLMLQLILRPERYLRDALGREPLGRWLHDGILLPKSLRRKT